LGKVLEMDGQLQRWRRSLPEHLSDSAANGDAILQRQAITLRIRLVPSPVPPSTLDDILVHQGTCPANGLKGSYMFEPSCSVQPWSTITSSVL
jgi:hypothetical protein